MAEQGENNNKVRKASFWPFIAWPAAVLIIYVLSIGPVVVMYSKGMIRHGKTEDFLEAVYKPLEFARYVPVVNTAVNSYIELWLKLFNEKWPLKEVK